jgi:hypothetical protein
MTSSLTNFLDSLLFGGLLVVFPITTALIIVSRIDPIIRD